jgi:hypothetical protein
MAVDHSSAVVGRRACAALAVLSAVLHGLMISQSAHPVIGLAILAMLATCVYCARDLWFVGSLRAWCLVALMNLGMIAIHWSVPGHHHLQSLLIHPGQPSTLAAAATAVSAVEVAIATAVMYVLTRQRAASVIAHRQD